MSVSQLAMIPVEQASEFVCGFKRKSQQMNKQPKTGLAIQYHRFYSIFESRISCFTFAKLRDGHQHLKPKETR